MLAQKLQPSNSDYRHMVAEDEPLLPKICGRQNRRKQKLHSSSLI